MMDPKRIGEMIKAKRAELQLTQEQLGQKLGVTAQAVSKWEQGVSLPDTALLPGLCRVLSIPADTLLGLAEKNNDPWTRYEEQIRRVQALSNVSTATVPFTLNLFAILVLLMYFIFRNESVAYFSIAVGGLAVIMVAGLLTARRRE